MLTRSIYTAAAKKSPSYQLKSLYVGTFSNSQRISNTLTFHILRVGEHRRYRQQNDHTPYLIMARHSENYDSIVHNQPIARSRDGEIAGGGA